MKQNWLLDNLVTHGLKATTPRRVITEYIIKHDGLFCPLQVAKKLSHVDRVSIYRTLESLKEIGSINPVISIDGQQFYEKNDQSDHHHHVICTKCKKTKCINCDHVAFPKVQGFSDIKHSIILTGLCTVCKKKR